MEGRSVSRKLVGLGSKMPRMQHDDGNLKIGIDPYCIRYKRLGGVQFKRLIRTIIKPIWSEHPCPKLVHPGITIDDDLWL